MVWWLLITSVQCIYNNIYLYLNCIKGLYYFTSSGVKYRLKYIFYVDW